MSAAPSNAFSFSLGCSLPGSHALLETAGVGNSGSENGHNKGARLFATFGSHLFNGLIVLTKYNGNVETKGEKKERERERKTPSARVA